MKREKYTLSVVVDPQADMDTKDVGDTVNDVLVTHLDGQDGVAYESLSLAQQEGNAEAGPLYVVVAMEYHGEFGTAEYVGRQVLHDLEENYGTDLPLRDARILWCSRDMPAVRAED